MRCPHVQQLDYGHPRNSWLLQFTEQHVPVVDDRADQQVGGAQPRPQLVDVVVGAPRIPRRVRAAEGEGTLIQLHMRDRMSGMLENRQEHGALREERSLSVETRKIARTEVWPTWKLSGNEGELVVPRATAILKLKLRERQVLGFHPRAIPYMPFPMPRVPHHQRIGSRCCWLEAEEEVPT
jgi:hypothetical protein